MKNKLKYILLSALFAGAFTSCEEDTELPYYQQTILREDFQAGNDNTILEIDGWRNYNQTGNVKWKIQRFTTSGVTNGYAEFTSYQSGDLVNVAWLITPPLALEAGNNRVLQFTAAQAFLGDAANKLEVVVSSDYDGVDVTGATWTPVQATLPTADADYYAFLDSGKISLSGLSGNVYIAFRVTGSGTNTNLDGTYQIDNVAVY